MNKITNPDLATLLESIVVSEYQGTPDVIGNSVWTNCLWHGFKGRKISGLFSAACEKKWIGTSEENTCWITQEGFNALTQWKLDNPSWKYQKV
jgi:hypothetical protein